MFFVKLDQKYKMNKSRDFTIIPNKVRCVACDSLFYNSSGEQLDLTSLFLDVINVTCVEEKFLKFCPQCTFQLKSIETLLSELDIISVRLENARNHVLAVAINTAFRLKYSDNSLDNESSTKSNAFVTLREKIIENWISLNQDEKNSVPSRSMPIPFESKNKSEQTGKETLRRQVHNYSVLSQNPSVQASTTRKLLPKLLSVAPNGLEISISDEQEYLEEEEEENSHDHSLENGAVVVEEVTDVEESNDDDDDDTTCHIKIEPGSWRTISDPKDFPGNHQHSPASANLTITQVDSDEEASNGNNNNNGNGTPQIVKQNSDIFYEESDYYLIQDQGQDEPQGKDDQVENAMSSSFSSSSPDRVSLQAKFPSTPPPPKLIAMTSLKQLQEHHKASIPKLKPSVAAGDQKESYIEMCTICYKFIVNGDPIRHLCEGKSTTSRYQCAYCNAVFFSEKVLGDHVRRHLHEEQMTTTKVETATEVPTKLNISVQTCKICKKKFANPGALSTHFKTDHGANDLFRCEHCPKFFVDASNLRLHMMAHAKNSEHAKAVNSHQIFQCAYCLRGFRLRNDLQRHLLIHTGEKPFRCHLCPKAFNRKHHLETHLEVHQRQALLRKTGSQNGKSARFSVKTRSSGVVKKEKV